MYEQFKMRAEAVSAEVYRHTTKAAAAEFIGDFLKREGVADAAGSYALWLESPFLKGLEREPFQQIPGLKFQANQDLAAQARFGISQMQWGLADTGSMAGDSSAIEQRLISSLPTIHIAIIPTSGILPDMPTLLTRLTPGESGYIAMITGPSRTADIERVLTIGVHGPERLVIVCVDELEGGN